ncbi:MAG: menaquinone biosynthesis protein [Rikenellaceae bacterium]
MSKIKIASVSYLNSVPFTYGINESGAIDAELILAPPVECSRLLSEGEVDIALIPVAATPNLGIDVEIITSHCIGTVGAVRTVVLLSDEEPKSIERIWLDTESQTSIKLLAHLCEHHFKITPEWHLLDNRERISHPEDGDAFLLIGDKVFEHEGEFEYTFDLAEEWMRLTSLPFVFAVWCAPRGVDEEIVEQLELALEWGVEHTFEALQAIRPDVEMEDGYRYLTSNIDTMLDGAKREAMRLFLASKSRIIPKTKES